MPMAAVYADNGMLRTLNLIAGLLGRMITISIKTSFMDSRLVSGKSISKLVSPFGLHSFGLPVVVA